MKRPSSVSRQRRAYERRLLHDLRSAGLPPDLAGQVREALRRARIQNGFRGDPRAVAELRAAERAGYGLLLAALKNEEVAV